jgi:hypothetical protein
LGGREKGWSGVVREGVGAGGEMTQSLYALMNNKIKIKKKKKVERSLWMTYKYDLKLP